MPPKKSFVIVIPVYPQVNLLDVAGPYEFFGWLRSFWQDADVQILTVGAADASGTPQSVTTNSTFTFQPDTTFDQCPQADLLLVPGGTPDALPTPSSDPALFNFLNNQCAGASYVTSVCVGALVLAAGGFLDNCNATTHWQCLDQLRAYKSIAVASGYPRYVWCQVNGKTYVTGGGVSSSLDTALFLIEKITGSSVTAGQVQLVVQYNPQPPLNDGDPSVASPQVLQAAGVPIS